MKFQSLTLFLILATVRSSNSAITAGQNLLTNGSATAGATAGWTIIAAGGNGWGTGSGGYDNLGLKFITSWLPCQRSQTIDLLAMGATAAELDEAPPLRVSEAITMNTDNGANDSYYIKVELRNAAGTAVASWNVATSTAMKTATTSWVVESHEFRDYGPGVRTIYFEDGGRDGGNWAGFYGTYHDAATVEFINKPVTDITLTPAGMPANVPAGGIAGQLHAVDADNTTHTFTLESEITTATAPLLASKEAGWRYYDSATPPATNWAASTFDDTAWGTGAAPLGYDSTATPTDTWQVTRVSYGGVATNKPLTTWFRKTFTVGDPTAFIGLDCTLMIDDGCVAYLNGQELFRNGIDEGITVTPTTPANVGISGSDESDYDPVVIPPAKLALLVPGTNVLAIETHQDKITSSDLSVDMTLSGISIASQNSYSNDLFEIAGTELRVKNGSAALAPGDYVVRVKAVDAAGNSLIKLVTVQRTATVSVSPPTALNLAAPAAVAENLPAGTLLGTFSVTDADSADAHGYTLTAGAGDEDNARVTIANNRLFVLQPPDFELHSTISVRVMVTDSGGAALTQTFSIAVTDNTTEDQDGDGLTEVEEDLNNNGVLEPGETDPLVADTDDDGYNDRIERNAGSDPRDKLSVPALVELLQTDTHATGQSWLTATSWAGDVVPNATHVTVTDNALVLRSPPSVDPVFPAGAADLRNGAVFRLKHTGLASVGRIILSNATIQDGMTGAITLGGGGARVEVPVAGTFDTEGNELNVQAALSGAGVIKVIGTTAGRLRLQKPAISFTGELSLENPEVILADPAALGSARRIEVKSGTLRTTSNTSLPGTVLARSGTGKIALFNSLTVGSLIVDATTVPPSTYTGAQLLALGIPAAAIEDSGGTITVGGPGSSVDTDGDGGSDYFETLAGTNPADPASNLRLGSVVPAGVEGTFHLEWVAVAGVTYTIQSATSLEGPWQDLGTVTPADTAGSYDATLTAPLPGKAFFRLSLE